MARVRARRNRLSSPTSVIALPRNIPPRWRGRMFALAANSLPASSPPPCRTPVAPPEHTPSPQTPPSVSPRPCLGARWRPRLCLRPQRSHPCGRAEKFRERTPEANRCETATLASEGFPFFRRKKLTRTVCTTRHSLLTDRIIYHSKGHHSKGYCSLAICRFTNKTLREHRTLHQERGVHKARVLRC